MHKKSKRTDWRTSAETGSAPTGGTGTCGARSA